MKLYCKISGLTYEASLGFGKHAQVNPAITTTKLQLEQLQAHFWNQYNDAKGNLGYTPNRYLYLLAWVNQLPKVQWRGTCNPEADYPVLLANAERLISLVQYTSKHRGVNYPTILVSEEAPIAECLTNWLDAISSSIADQLLDRNATNYSLKLEELSTVLEGIRSLDSARVATKHAPLVAQWASTAAHFPKSVAKLWQDIVIASMRRDTRLLASNKVTKADVEELIEHCEGNIPHGSYHAHALMAALRQADELLNQLREQTLRLAAANRVAKPTTPEPKRADYTSMVEYMRAKMAWQRTAQATPTPEASPAEDTSVDLEAIADIYGI